MARLASAVLALLAIGLGVAFEGQNVAFMVGLAFSIAASANFPALLLSMTWAGFTTRGAVASMATGTIASVVLITLSPTVWVGLLGQAEAIVPLRNPGIITVPLSFVVGIVVSLLAPEPAARAAFAAARRRMHLGPAAADR